MTDTTETTERLVVAVDFTPASEHAIVAALRLAQAVPHTALHIVHVLPVDPWIKTDGMERESDAMDAATKRLRETILEVGARTTGHRWDQTVHFHVRLGDAVEAIHQVAIDVNADMIVVGTHGRKGLEKLLLGSVATRLIADAHLPVLVARPKELDGLPRTEKPAAATPGADLHAPRTDMSAVLEFVPRSTHVSGNI